MSSNAFENDILFFVGHSCLVASCFWFVLHKSFRVRDDGSGGGDMVTLIQFDVLFYKIVQIPCFFPCNLPCDESTIFNILNRLCRTIREIWIRGVDFMEHIKRY